MQVNNIIVPDPSVSKAYFADPIGGWLYEVVTEVSVNQLRLDRFDTIKEEALAKVAKAQEELANITTNEKQFEAEIATAKQATAAADAAFVAEKQATIGK